MTDTVGPDHDQEGLDQRPGGPLVPGLRRLRRAHRRPDADARAGREARAGGVRVRHRLLQPVPVLHEHLRHPQHPRAGAGHRHRHRRGPAGPRRVGDHRRRRRAVDRGQPLHPRAAPQRQPHDPAVQQPDLRAHQGPVLAHVGAGQGHEVDALRQPRSALQPAGGGARRRGHLRRPHPRPRPQAHDRGLPRRRTPTVARRWSRSSRTATCSTMPPSRT